jgi:hypothetical protein
MVCNGTANKTAKVLALQVLLQAEHIFDKAFTSV